MDNLIAEVQSVLRTTSSRFHRFEEHLNPWLLQRQPAPGEWSAYECLYHLVELERWVFPVRVKTFLAGEPMPAFDPDKAAAERTGNKSMEELLTEFDSLRAESLALLDTLTEADLERFTDHSQLGRVTLGEMLHEWTGHDLMHTVQAEQAMMQPFIAGCGAWQGFFESHVIKTDQG